MKYSIILLLSIILIAGISAPVYAQTITDTVVVTVSSDKSSYLFDETAIISGTVSEKIFIEKPYFQPEPILITISGPNFDHAFHFILITI